MIDHAQSVEFFCCDKHRASFAGQMHEALQGAIVLQQVVPALTPVTQALSTKAASVMFAWSYELTREF